jgi:hypothetical protein
MKETIKGLIAPFLILTLALFLTQGCASTTPANEAADDSYQFGDITKSAVAQGANLLVLRYRYCIEQDPEVREAMLEIIKVVAPQYPSDGICTNLSELVQEVKALQNAAAATQEIDDVMAEGAEDMERRPEGL